MLDKFFNSKRSQFYLIAAIVIIVVIIGLYGVGNKLTSNTSPKVYNLQKELSLEGVNVVDYGVYSQLNGSQMNVLLENFSAYYTAFAGQGKSLYFIIGNQNGVFLKSYQDVTSGSVCIQVGGQCSGLTLTDKQSSTTTLFPQGNSVETIINGQNYNFTLNEGQNFYFIITQQNQGGTNVVSG